MAEQRQTSGIGSFIAWILVAAAIVAADQASKGAIVKWLSYGDAVPLNSFINLTHHRNPGAAWSFLANAGGWQSWFLSGLAGVVSLVLLVWLFRIRRDRLWLLSAGLALVLGGAIGNLIDRLRLGYVTDFLQVYLGESIGYFPSFNVADAAISVGAVFLIVDSLFVSGRN